MEKIEITTWQDAALDAVQTVHQLKKSIEDQLESKFPGSRCRIVLRNVVMEAENIFSKAFDFNNESPFEVEIDGKQYHITQAGACDTAADHHDDELFIQFKFRPKAPASGGITFDL